jgi:hypothetical protein
MQMLVAIILAWEQLCIAWALRQSSLMFFLFTMIEFPSFRGRPIRTV